MTKDRTIGDKNSIPWHISGEMKLFRELTMGNSVIMGRSTWLSLPDRFRPLPGRVNIIVSRTMDRQQGATVCRSVDEALHVAGSGTGEAFCIGGAQLYRAMLPLAQVLHVSWVKKGYIGDVHFPEVDFTEWKETMSRDFEEFTYKRYARA